MDWSILSVTALESWQVFAEKEKVLAATLKYLPGSRRVEVALPFMNRPAERVAIRHLPFHVYNFDLASLNFAFRHLVNPRKLFKVGISDPTFSDSGPAFLYRGEVEIVYDGDEPRNGVPCRRYRINGTGLANRGGLIWVAKNGGHFEDIEIALPDNPNWSSFKFKLQGKGKFSRARWQEFIKAQF